MATAANRHVASVFRISDLGFRTGLIYTNRCLFPELCFTTRMALARNEKLEATLIKIRNTKSQIRNATLEPKLSQPEQVYVDFKIIFFFIIHTGSLPDNSVE